MSLNHILAGGRKDVNLDVKSIETQSLLVNGSGILPMEVKEENLTITSETPGVNAYLDHPSVFFYNGSFVFVTGKLTLQVVPGTPQRFTIKIAGMPIPVNIPSSGILTGISSATVCSILGEGVIETNGTSFDFLISNSAQVPFGEAHHLSCSFSFSYKA